MSIPALFSLIKKAVTPNYDKQIEQFKSMGFHADDAEKYLKKYNGDNNLVLQHLLKDEKAAKKKKKQKKQKKPINTTKESSINRISTDKSSKSEEKQNSPQLNTEESKQKMKDITDEKPDETEVFCKCGTKMKLLQPQECKISIGLQCNNKKCKKEIKRNEWFYHCIHNSSNTEIHIGPYNYCQKCAHLKVKLLKKQKRKKEEKEQKEKEEKEEKEEKKMNDEWTPKDIYDIFNKVNSKINLPKFDFLSGKNGRPETMEDIQEKFDLTEDQMALLYLIPDEMQKHVAIWIKATNADYKLINEYNEICKHIFNGIDMEKFPHFVVFGCDSIEFEQLHISQKYAMQRILIILANTHYSLTYCPQIVHLIGILLNKMDEKCVFAVCSAMLNISKVNKNIYFTFDYVNNCIRIQTLLSLIENNVKMVALHLKEKKININDLITNAMESMYVGYLTEETYLCLIDKFLEKGYKILHKIGVSLIKNCQKQLIETNNICQFKSTLIKHSKKLSPKDLNSWSFMVYIWDFGNNSFENLEDLHKNNRDNYLNEPNPQNMIRLWPKWENQKIIDSKSKIFTEKWMYYQIWTWLPPNCHLGEFQLLFNTHIHGYKLISLYYYCINHENLIIFIKTNDNEIFGAFVSTIGHEQHWKNFLFDPKAFVFILKSNNNNINVEKREYKNAVLSVLPTKNSLSIGYQNSNLIFIDEGLKHGFSDQCKKLNSSSLCCSKTGQFNISSIEVWSVEHEFQRQIKPKESIHTLCEHSLHRLSKVLFGGRQHNHNQYASF